MAANMTSVHVCLQKKRLIRVNKYTVVKHRSLAWHLHTNSWNNWSYKENSRQYTPYFLPAYLLFPVRSQLRYVWLIWDMPVPAPVPRPAALQGAAGGSGSRSITAGSGRPGSGQTLPEPLTPSPPYLCQRLAGTGRQKKEAQGFSSLQLSVLPPAPRSLTFLMAFSPSFLPAGLAPHPTPPHPRAAPRQAAPAELRACLRRRGRTWARPPPPAPGSGRSGRATYFLRSPWETRWQAPAPECCVPRLITASQASRAAQPGPGGRRVSLPARPVSKGRPGAAAATARSRAEGQRSLPAVTQPWALALKNTKLKVLSFTVISKNLPIVGTHPCLWKTVIQMKPAFCYAEWYGKCINVDIHIFLKCQFSSCLNPEKVSEGLQCCSWSVRSATHPTKEKQKQKYTEIKRPIIKVLI